MSKHIYIHDGNFESHINPPEGYSTGLVPRDFQSFPHGSLPYMRPMLEIKIPSRQERIERIRWNRANGCSLKQQIEKAGEALWCLDQNGTNFCWANAPTMAMMIARYQQNQSGERLSPASIAAPVRNYSNQGGWGGEAVQYGSKYGWLPQSVWPANAIDRRLDTPESRTLRDKYRCTEQFVDMPPRNWELAATLIVFYYTPVAFGLNWWSHEVLGVDIEENDDTVILNSWGRSYGTNGFATLSRSKATADDQCCIYNAMAA